MSNLGKQVAVGMLAGLALIGMVGEASAARARQIYNDGHIYERYYGYDQPTYLYGGRPGGWAGVGHRDAESYDVPGYGYGPGPEDYEPYGYNPY